MRCNVEGTYNFCLHCTLLFAALSFASPDGKVLLEGMENPLILGDLDFLEDIDFVEDIDYGPVELYELEEISQDLDKELYVHRLTDLF